MALARGALDEAERWIGEARERAAEDAEVLEVAAAVLEARGRSEEAQGLLWRALQSAPRHLAAHTRLLALTGPAPRPLPADPDGLVAAFRAHPYDPAVLLAVGRAAASAGRPARATGYLEAALWLGDRDPVSAREAWRSLQALDPDFARRRRVPVHVLADASLRAREGWAFQVRWLLQRLTADLDGSLGVVFAPVSMGAFDPPVGRGELDPMLAALRSPGAPQPREGVIALLTARPAPPGARRYQLGLAEFLGRRLVARLPAGVERSHTLTHEVLHLFGAMHVNPDIASLMNPSGEAWALDRPNAGIVRVLRGRSFGPGGWEANVFARVELEALAEAYLALVQTNLTLRRLGVEDALAAARSSRVAGARLLLDAAVLDTHLGDVCAFGADLLWRVERRVEATVLLESAGVLYGPRTARGRAALQQAERARRDLRRRYGLD